MRQVLFNVKIYDKKVHLLNVRENKQPVGTKTDHLLGLSLEMTHRMRHAVGESEEAGLTRIEISVYDILEFGENYLQVANHIITSVKTLLNSAPIFPQVYCRYPTAKIFEFLRDLPVNFLVLNGLYASLIYFRNEKGVSYTGVTERVQNSLKLIAFIKKYASAHATIRIYRLGAAREFLGTV